MTHRVAASLFFRSAVSLYQNRYFQDHSSQLELLLAVKNEFRELPFQIPDLPVTKRAEYRLDKFVWYNALFWRYEIFVFLTRISPFLWTFLIEICCFIAQHYVIKNYFHYSSLPYLEGLMNTAISNVTQRATKTSWQNRQSEKRLR